jgi:hypothetical protein
MVNATEESNEWRAFIPSDLNTHPMDESDVEFELVEGTRISGRYRKGLVHHNDRVPKQLPPDGAQKWRYKPRE